MRIRKWVRVIFPAEQQGKSPGPLSVREHFMKRRPTVIYKKKNCKMLYYIKLHKNNIAKYSTDAHCTSSTKAHHQGPHSHRSTRTDCSYQCSRQSTSCSERSWQSLRWCHTSYVVDLALFHDW